MKLCWNAIVKNEADRILRAAASVIPYIHCAVICDTGSTDDTVSLLKTLFETAKIPLEITHCEFKNFSQARNHALFAAQKSRLEWDYAILMDADMELRVNDPTWLNVLAGGAPAYDMFQEAGAVHYANRRFAKRGETQGYLGVTHEYLDLNTGGVIAQKAANFYDHADGANRPDKLKRDIKLLKKGLEDEPENARYMYYLAQSYRDAGKHEKAEKWYKRRIKAGGWEEEVWSAQYCMAHTIKDQGRDAEWIACLLTAYNMRPTRAEPLYDLAKWYREKGLNPAACLMAEGGMGIPRSTDALFINDFVYDVGCADEYSIAAFYVPGKRASGFKVTSALSLKRGPYGISRELARNNLYHYLPSLKDLCPSFEWKTIKLDAGEHWTAMNPSITNHKGSLCMVIRTVNYRMDDQGRYLIRATDGTANDSNPINTRNFLVNVNKETLAISDAKEIRAPQDMPVLFKPVIGFEDMRLFSLGNTLWTSSTTRQSFAHGMPVQTLAHIGPGCALDNVKYMIRNEGVCEKNWAPITVPGMDRVRFMYRPGHVVDDTGATMVDNEHPTLDLGGLSGSSQVLKTAKGWLYITHEARILPGQHMRYYIHRFVILDNDFKVVKISVPFCFNDKVIEFCAGIAQKDLETIVMSYGYRDAEARIGTVKMEEVERFVWAS